MSTLVPSSILTPTFPVPHASHHSTLSTTFAAFAESTGTGGEFHISTAGENGVFSPVRTGLKAEAGGRPLGSDGLQTFGGVRALARYVRIEAVPAEVGSIGINEASQMKMENTKKGGLPRLEGGLGCLPKQMFGCVMQMGLGTSPLVKGPRLCFAIMLIKAPNPSLNDT